MPFPEGGFLKRPRNLTPEDVCLTHTHSLLPGGYTLSTFSSLLSKMYGLHPKEECVRRKIDRKMANLFTEKQNKEIDVLISLSGTGRLMVLLRTDFCHKNLVDELLEMLVSVLHTFLP